MRKKTEAVIAEPRMSVEELTRMVIEAEEAHRRLAVDDPAAFNEYVLRHEETGARVMNSPQHVRWQRELSKHNRVVLWGHTESAKTQQISVGRSLWELGKNPNLRIVVVMNTDKMAQKVGSQAAKYITQSMELRAVFPKMVPDPLSSWTAHQFTVMRGTYAKDPSFQTCGMHGNILGARIDLLILDDILDYESTRTLAMCQDGIAWYKSTLEGRLTPKSRVWALGMIWDAEDLLHLLSKNPLYHVMRSPVLDDEGKSTWPEQWPMERIEERRIELGPLEFDRQMMCRLVSKSESRFKVEWIQRCLDAGNGLTLSYALSSIPFGFRTVTGVDLAVKQKKTSAETVLFTILVGADGTREVLDITAGKFRGREIIDKILDVQRRYQSLVVVEDNAAQDYILQFVREEANIPLEPYTTNAKIKHPTFGVESIGAEMAAALWIIPNQDGAVHPEVKRWIDELVYYQPDAHAGDRLMASFFAREGSTIRKARRRAVTMHVDTMTR